MYGQDDLINFDSPKVRVLNTTIEKTDEMNKTTTETLNSTYCNIKDSPMINNNPLSLLDNSLTMFERFGNMHIGTDSQEPQPNHTVDTLNTTQLVKISPIHPESPESSDADETGEEVTEISTSGTEETVIERKIVENQAPPKAAEVLRDFELENCELREQVSNLLKKCDQYEHLNKEYQAQFTTYYESLLSYKHQYTKASTNLSNLEDAFSELHKKYKHAKDVINGMKKNEDIYKEHIRSVTEQCEQQAKEIRDIKETFQNQVNKANETNNRLKSENDDKIKKLNNYLKVNEIKLASTEKALEQKVQECEEMTKYLEYPQ